MHRHRQRTQWVSLPSCTAVCLWQDQLKHCPVRGPGRSPQAAAMSFNNGTADRQSHANTLGLGGKEGFKDTPGLLQIESSSGILNLDQHTLGVHRRLDEQI